MHGQPRVLANRNTIMDTLALPLSTLLPLGGLILFLAVYLVPTVLGKRKYPLPPGPPGEFILGHYRKIPFVAAFKQYAQWGREYSMSACQESYHVKLRRLIGPYRIRRALLRDLRHEMDCLEQSQVGYGSARQTGVKLQRPA